MLLGDAAANVQTQADARVPAGVDVGRAVEAVEDVRQVGGRDPDAVVLDGDADLAIVAPGPDLDLGVADAVLEAVLDEVVDELLDPPPVVAAGQPTIRLEDDPVLMRKVAVSEVPPHLSQLHGLPADLEIPFLDPQRITQILDETGPPTGHARVP